MFSARSFSSGCFIGSVFTPVGVADAARPAAALTARRIAAPARAAAARPARGGGGLVVVRDPLGRAAVALELRLDPVDRGAVAIGALAAIAELRQPLDRRLVLFEIEAADQRLHRIGARRRLRGRLRCKAERQEGRKEQRYQGQKARGRKAAGRKV